ncbi:MAG: DUF2520 domain-containing protein [Taibaiella sp.]|jgi:predicted short-subunit dehydrogenase-like oxidoreductase (DUF2520 family)
MRIVFIGSGNIAHFFIPRLQRKGHDIVQIYSPTLAHGQALASLCNVAHVTDQLHEIVTDAEVYVLAIKDDALPLVAKQLNFEGKVVIHCAGAVSLDVIANISEQRAVIWALYSIKKTNLPQDNKVPLIVEAKGAKALDVATALAYDISDVVLQTDFVQRQMLHLNAVFVNNFTNHLLTIAQKIGEEHQLPFNILHPIISQTLERIGNAMPAEMQTGPAIRHDNETIQKHLALLEAHPEWQQIYADISKSIQQTAK